MLAKSSAHSERQQANIYPGAGSSAACCAGWMQTWAVTGLSSVCSPPHAYLQYLNHLMNFCTNLSLGECFTHVRHQSNVGSKGAYVSLMWERCRGRRVPKGRL